MATYTCVVDQKIEARFTAAEFIDSLLDGFEVVKIHRQELHVKLSSGFGGHLLDGLLAALLVASCDVYMGILERQLFSCSTTNARSAYLSACKCWFLLHDLYINSCGAKRTSGDNGDVACKIRDVGLGELVSHGC